MVTETKNAWAGLPAELRTWLRRGAYTGGLLLAVTGGLAAGGRGGAAADPVHVERNAAAIDTLRLDVREIRSTQAKDRAYIYTELEFLTCERRAANGVDGQTLADCVDDYRRNTRER